MVLVVESVLGLGLDLLSGWLVGMRRYLYYFPLSLSTFINRYVGHRQPIGVICQWCCTSCSAAICKWHCAMVCM